MADPYAQNLILVNLKYLIVVTNIDVSTTARYHGDL